MLMLLLSKHHDMELLKAFENFRYPNDIGPGVYDIHSPRIPSVDEIIALIEKAAQYIPIYSSYGLIQIVV